MVKRMGPEADWYQENQTAAEQEATRSGNELLAVGWAGNIGDLVAQLLPQDPTTGVSGDLDEPLVLWLYKTSDGEQYLVIRNMP